MSTYHIGRIASVLTQTFDGHIDMADWSARTALERKNAFLSRALAALCVKVLSGVSDTVAANSVVDEYGDGGIDALHFNQDTDTFHFVQSKWSGEGTGCLDQSSSMKFVSGVRDILAGKLDRFGSRIRHKEAEIRTALQASRPIKISLITAHTSEQPLGAHALHEINDLVAELNMPVLPEQAMGTHLRQSDIYSLITSLSEPPNINLSVTLNNFGFIEKPFLSYYGQTSALEISGWWKQYGTAICTRNIRNFLQRSAVNEALRQSLLNTPENFWYLNNGVTIICDSLQKSLTGAPRRDVGLFNCKGVSVVNGAQTVGVIGTTLPTMTDPNVAWVQVKIISLESAPSGFDRNITQATNFQNSVGVRDWVSMDPCQQRIATDFALDRRRYAYKTGEDEAKGAAGCSVTEAIQALGCALSMEVAVLVKRNLGEVSDPNAKPYTDIFNEALSSEMVWNAVRIMRAVDEELQDLSRQESPKVYYVAVHLNRSLLHLVFRDLRVREFRREKIDEEKLVADARQAVKDIFPRAVEYIERHHSNEYIGNLCKNTDKCVAMGIALLKPPEAIEEHGAGQGTLFS